MKQREIETPHGPARVQVDAADSPRAALLLGHGAGGGTDAPDLKAASEAAKDSGLTVTLVEQPYRVAGRRSPAPAKQLDAAWIAVVETLREGPLAELPLVAGGRSSGARVACRTAEATKATAVLCLAFPEHPPGKPERSRQDELDAVEVPVLVVQGESDPFGMPQATKTAEVVTVPGNHSLKQDLGAVRAAIAGWLPTVL
ncbi:MAG: alpha/beta hydrolase family protein [Solirubrobacterales bacterium]